jgi:hypothetical protein
MPSGPESDAFSEQVSAWREAAEDLGVMVEAPFELAAGRTYRCVGRVKQFGSSIGVLIARMDDEDIDEVRKAAKNLGLYCSAIYPTAYRTYERDLFIATLDDWAWFGPAELAPAWYTGTPWGH